MILFIIVHFNFYLAELINGTELGKDKLFSQGIMKGAIIYSTTSRVLIDLARDRPEKNLQRLYREQNVK